MDKIKELIIQRDSLKKLLKHSTNKLEVKFKIKEIDKKIKELKSE